MWTTKHDHMQLTFLPPTSPDFPQHHILPTSSLCFLLFDSPLSITSGIPWCLQDPRFFFPLCFCLFGVYTSIHDWSTLWTILAFFLILGRRIRDKRQGISSTENTTRVLHRPLLLTHCCLKAGYSLHQAIKESRKENWMAEFLWPATNWYRDWCYF